MERRKPSDGGSSSAFLGQLVVEVERASGVLGRADIEQA
jgi:hypothetical protein